MEQKRTLILQYNLQWFAKDGPGGEKTEPATAKRLSDARSNGQVAKSKELTAAFNLIVLFLTLKVFVSSMGQGFLNVFNYTYKLIPDFLKNNAMDLSAQAVSGFFRVIFQQMLGIVWPFFLFGYVINFLLDLLQVGWKVTTKPLKPKLNRFNPVSGFKRFFSKKSIFELFKAMLKVILIFYIAYSSIKDRVGQLYILYNISLWQAIGICGDIIINTGLKIAIVYLFIGFADYVYQKHHFKEEMKMTKQEVKDEYKNAEGDPKIKGKQRQRMQEASRRRMMQSVPNADVVITNPTHFAVAIKYEPEANRAPVVLAKGEDYLAQKIKELARENNVKIVENKPLARMLYANVEVGNEIPPELYQAVAEILAMVYNTR